MMTPLELDLAHLLGEAALRVGDATLPYLHDATEMQGLRGWADAVVVPADVEGISRLVRWCYGRGIPLVPRGGGTGFAGGAVPFGGVVCSLEALNQIRSLEAEYWRAEVEAGVITARLHRAARASGLFFGPDPGASAESQIGGNVACNAGGPHSFKYGSTGSWVSGLEAVIGDGEIVRFGGTARKDVAGYDLRSLMVGSEGTLGVITRVWLKLLPAPETSIPVVAAYPTLRAGVDALGRIYASGLVPATIEYFDQGALLATRAAFPESLHSDTAFLILAEADGGQNEAEQLSRQLLETLAGDALAVVEVTGRARLQRLEAWRSGVSYAVSAQRGGKISEDIAVPFDALEAAIMGVTDIGARVGLPCCSWGHAGDGNLHATFLIDASSPTDMVRAETGIEALFALALRLGGTVSGEHGLGWVKRGQLERQMGSKEVLLMAGVKDLFDPAHLFNPGKKGLGGTADDHQERTVSAR